MKTREIACQYYICEGQCSKGRGGTFRKACQHCDKYLAIKGGKSARPNRKREKLDKIYRKERYYE